MVTGRVGSAGGRWRVEVRIGLAMGGWVGRGVGVGKVVCPGPRGPGAYAGREATAAR